MIRKVLSLMMLGVLASFALISCGPEDVSDIEIKWIEEEQSLVNKTNEVQAKHAELMERFTTMPALNATDSTTEKIRATTEQMLDNQATTLQEVNETIQSEKDARQSVTEAGVRADYEAAMGKATVAYEGAMAKLNTIADQQRMIAEKMNNMEEQAESEAPATDTTATSM